MQIANQLKLHLMKKKSSSQSAFFNVRVLIGLFMVLAGVFLALAGFGTYSAVTASSAQAQQKTARSAQAQQRPKIVNVPGLPPGFDCSTIHEKGIDKQENFAAGLIMMACGEGEGANPSRAVAFSQFVNGLLPKPLVPLAHGGADVDLITSPERFPHVTQS